MNYNLTQFEPENRCSMYLRNVGNNVHIQQLGSNIGKVSELERVRLEAIIA
jgi:hypothetical protein